MNHQDAEEMAKRIINTWRGGPPLAEWIDALTPLDEGTAGTTFVRLRAAEQHAPSIAKFLGTYRTLQTPANNPINRNPDCTRCDGNGAINAWTLTHPDDGHRLQYACRYAYCCPTCRGAAWLTPLPAGLPATAFDPAPPPEALARDHPNRPQTPDAEETAA